MAKRRKSRTLRSLSRTTRDRERNRSTVRRSTRGTRSSPVETPVTEPTTDISAETPVNNPVTEPSDTFPTESAGDTAANTQTQTPTNKPPRTTLGPPNGTPGPGPNEGGEVDFRKTGVNGEDFDTFGCKVFRTNPDTPDWRRADVYFERKMFGSHDIKMPDPRRTKVRFWGFEDRIADTGEQVPSTMIRVVEDQMVHVELKSSKGSHTIHHHAIEPTTMNDGVGHVSMEVTGSYIYQWQPRQAGTYFYHCHKNTVLHFEMGMFGLLIVDPRNNDEYFAQTGRRLAYNHEGSDRVPEYDAEQAWVFDDVDPVWHEIPDRFDADAGLCGEDVGLNNFNPKFFMINGEARKPRKSASSPNTPIKKAGIIAWEGDKILIRTLNASYSVVKMVLPLEAQLISVDGRPLNQPWNNWITYKAGEPIYISTAVRYDLLIDLTAPANKDARGVQTAEFEFQHWVKRTVHNKGDLVYEGTASATIEIV